MIKNFSFPQNRIRIRLQVPPRRHSSDSQAAACHVIVLDAYGSALQILHATQSTASLLRILKKNDLKSFFFNICAQGRIRTSVARRRWIYSP